MRWLLLPLMAGCAVKTSTMAITEPLMLEASTRPIPDGMVAGSPERVEVRACGAEYAGLHTMIAQAQRDRDALLEVVVDVQRIYRIVESSGSVDTVLDTQCYILRAERVTFVPAR